MERQHKDWVSSDNDASDQDKELVFEESGSDSEPVYGDESEPLVTYKLLIQFLSLFKQMYYGRYAGNCALSELQSMSHDN